MDGQTNALKNGDDVRRSRETLGLSRLALAYKSGLNLRTIERIETGEVTPRRSTLKVIEWALEAEQAKAVA